MGGVAVPGMLVRHSAHLLVDRQQQQQQQQVSQPPSVRLLVLMGGAFCFSFGCVFSPCYEMPVSLLPPSAASAPARALVEVDVLLCPKVWLSMALFIACRSFCHTSLVARDVTLYAVTRRIGSIPSHVFCFTPPLSRPHPPQPSAPPFHPLSPSPALQSPFSLSILCLSDLTALLQPVDKTNLIALPVLPFAVEADNEQLQPQDVQLESLFSNIISLSSLPNLSISFPAPYPLLLLASTRPPLPGSASFPTACSKKQESQAAPPLKRLHDAMYANVHQPHCIL